jgi:GT2 family glycosyltransferase
MAGRVSVVVVTRDRREELLRSLDRLIRLPERPPVIVVDNASTDGTPEAVRSTFPEVSVVELAENRGATARTVGVEAATTPYVAFSDDDSWWAPGALSRAETHFDAHPRLAVLAARILVGEDEWLDPVCEEMARSPLPAEPDLPGPPVLGFVACGTVVRRDAYLHAGGFDDLLFFFGEETMLALDLAGAGWGLAYLDDVVAHHHPSAARDPARRRRLAARNDLLTTWMRRRARPALRYTARTAVAAATDRDVRAGALDACRALPEALRRRRAVGPDLERRVALLDPVR